MPGKTLNFITQSSKLRPNSSESIAQSITTIKYLLWLNSLILVEIFGFIEQKNSVAHC